MKEQLPSKYQIGDTVTFTYDKWTKHYDKSEEAETTGMVVAVKFTMTSEVYDILNHDTGDVDYKISLDKIK